MKKIQRYLFFAVLSICSVNASAQLLQVSNLTGTQTYGGVAVTVTPSGSYNANGGGGFCLGGGGGQGNTVPYWAGPGGQGNYTYTFGTPVAAVMFTLEGLNAGEFVQIYINGVAYNLTAGANGEPCFTLCNGGGPQGTITNGVYNGPNPYGGGQIYITFPTPTITSVELYCNGTLSGVDFYMFFSPTPIGNPCSSASNNGPICAGQTLDLFGTGAVNNQYYWYGPNGFTSTLQNPTIPNATVATAGTYTMVLNGGGPGDTSTTIVIVNPLPVITASSNSPVCTGNPINFTVSSNPASTTFVWQGPNGYVSNVQNAVIPSAILTDAGTYTVSTTVGGCADTVTTNVVVNQTPPTPTAGSNSPVCSGGTLLLNASSSMNGVSYSWAGPNNFTSNAQNPTVNGISAQGFGVYTVTTTMNGCSTSATTTVSIGQTPDVPVITSNTPLCSGNDLMLSVSSTPGATFTWTGPHGFTSIASDTTIANAQTNNGGVYTVVALFDGCTSQRSATLIVKQTPLPPPVTDVMYCQYDPSTAIQAYGDNLLWYTVPTGGVADSTAPVPTTQNTDSLVYFVSQTVNGCESGRNPVTAKVNYKALYNISSNSAVCLHDTALFTYNGTTNPDGTSYLWRTVRTEALLDGQYTGGASILFDSIGTHKVYLTVTNPQGLCPSLDSTTIFVSATPVVAISVPKDVCAQSEVTINSFYATQDVGQYSWDFDGGNVLSGDVTTGGPFTVSFPDAGQHHITMMATSRYGCAGALLTDTIYAHPAPNAVIAYPVPGSTVTKCTGDTLHLVAGAYNSGYKYEWAPVQYFSDNTGERVLATVNGSADITLTVTDQFGCQGSTAQKIATQPCCTIFFPNAFTPNGDGLNDVFKPKTTGHHNVKSFIVQNRWGQTIFSSANEDYGWNGTFNGVPQDMGVYYWYIKYDCTNGNTTEQKGQVMLVR